MEELILEDLEAQLDRGTPAALHVRLSGRSASREAGKTLAPLFDRAIAIARSETRALVVHFEKLEYFNSSTIAALVQFIRSAQDSALGLTVVYDGKQKWQAMSFDALRRALRPFEMGTGHSVEFTESAPGGATG